MAYRSIFWPLMLAGHYSQVQLSLESEATLLVHSQGKKTPKPLFATFPPYFQSQASDLMIFPNNFLLFSHFLRSCFSMETGFSLLLRGDMELGVLRVWLPWATHAAPCAGKDDLG